jgi:anti-sigma factor RsiW
MSCGRARRLLWPDGGPREVTSEIVAAREHVAGCDTCQSFLEDVRRISGRIGRAAPRHAAPAEVRDRLFQVIARARTDAGSLERTPHASRRRQFASAGIAAVLIIGLSWLGYLAVRIGVPQRDTVGSLVEDQLRSQNGAGLISSDSVQVALWLRERLPFAVQVPLFPDARLTGARLLVADRRSGAVIEYVVGVRTLTYYVLPGKRGSHRQVELASRNGYRVASWRDDGLTHALVATLPGPKLMEYARYCIHQMTA